MSSDSIRPDPTVIGDVAAPPFARLPDSIRLFIDRTLRFRSLANGSELAPYLRFLAGLTEIQYRIQDGLPEPCLPPAGVQERARKHGMPPIDRAGFQIDPAFEMTLSSLFAAASDLPKPPSAEDALKRVDGAAPAVRASMLRAVLTDSIPAGALAEHAYIAAAAQVHFARCAARLDADRLVPVGGGACPACGCLPVGTMVVGWQGAYGSRFCSCALCGVLWNYVRIKCVLCGSTKGIGYQEVEGSAGTVKAETCDNCHRYLKVFYQVKDHVIEPVADDVASLGLDVLMGQGAYRRGGFNPFLLGY